ncbi:caspase family protein [Cytophagaceae bacterium YF14B1]|uniref:Caspase family protein n=1 Tax=Xanthocytophaga flava TaxID=3048013 RepID=A0AAE3QZG1_9BACT|nr:caspase family protein [Xanthocytophaga flavus]MDJ1485980.1 caspase family protein [Xanthocytophaga flavus]
MQKIALLIGSPLVKGSNYLSGVSGDIQNFESFLLSPIGGGWQKEEIVTFPLNPTKRDVLRYLIALKQYDYAFVYFSGHGKTQATGVSQWQSVQLNQAEELNITQFQSSAKRQLTIIDACRDVEDFSNFSGVSGIWESSSTGEQLVKARTIYNNCLSKFMPGYLVWYATQLGTTATDDGRGGVFSNSVLRAVSLLNKHTNKDIITIADVHRVASKLMEKYSQVPQLVSDGRLLQLPFAVKSSMAKHIVEPTSDINWKEFILGLIAVSGVFWAINQIAKDR